ncbi:hypothetical protein [Streptomyces sp. NPDC001880]
MGQSSASAPPQVPVRRLPPPSLWSFLLLLGLIFCGAYAVGTVSGPVAPGMVGSPGSGGGHGDAEMPMDHSGGHR